MSVISEPASAFKAEDFEDNVIDLALAKDIRALMSLSPEARRKYWDFCQERRRHRPAVKFTILTNAKGLATKVFTLNGAGELEKKSVANIWDGRYHRREVRGVLGLLDAIKGLDSAQANTYGVPERESGSITTQKAHRLNGSGDAIPRDSAHYFFPEGEPGVFMGDYDPRKDHGAPYSWQELDRIICEVRPQIADVERVWRPSASSYIYRTSDGKELIGSGGWRLYFLVDDASKIPSFGEALYQDLWKAGHGYIQLSKAGSLLDRSIVDASVWQAERLDFAAAPQMGEGLERRAQDHVILAGMAMLMTAGLPTGMPMKEWRKTSPELKQKQHEIKPQVAPAQKQFAEKRSKELKAKGFDVPAAIIEHAVRERKPREYELPRDFVVTTEGGLDITVGKLLDHPEKWHETRFHDPFQPDWPDPRIAVAYFNEPPYGSFIYSHIHGGLKYRLLNTNPTPTKRQEIKKLVLVTDPKTGKIIKDARNFKRIADHEMWEFSFNEFTGRQELEGLPGYPILDDAAYAMIRQSCFSKYAFKLPKDDLYEIVSILARQRRHHPVRDYLDGLVWDGTRRLDTWLHIYFGAENTPANRAIGRKTLIAGVRRVRHPGCQCKYMMVLTGKQDQGKSKAIAKLCHDPDWFSDNFEINKHADSKRVIEQTRGYWIVEIPDLKIKDIDRIKPMLSRNTDADRLSYGRERTEVPRGFIFIGTCNELVLEDTTGNVRFWPVECDVEDIDIEALVRDRDQLWAEAAYREKEGEAIHLTAADADALQGIRALQSAHEAGDEIHNALALWVEGTVIPPRTPYSGGGMPLKQIAEQALGIEIADLRKDTEMRIGSALRKLGFTRQKSNGIVRWKLETS